MHKLLFGFVFVCFFATNAYSLTYEVTSSKCAGPGSFQDAVKKANENPGVDTISFQTDVNEVNGNTCGMYGVEPNQMYMAAVTDDLVIEGNAFAINGNGLYLTNDGGKNKPGICPVNNPSYTKVIRPHIGFLRVEDNVSLTVRNLKLEELRSITYLLPGVDLTLDQVTTRNIYDFYNLCDFNPIQMNFPYDQNVTITDSYFGPAWNAAQAIAGNPENGTQYWGNAFILGSDGNGTISISDSIFEVKSIPSVNNGGTLRVENTKFIDSGFINSYGDATIVNSIFTEKTSQGTFQRIVASGGGTIELEASTIALGSLDCNSTCAITMGPGVIIAASGGSITLKASAVNISFPDSSVEATVLIREASGGDVKATGAPNPNWIQPVFAQPADALRSILDQPALLTDAPGLPPNVFYGFLYKAVTPLLDDGAGTPGLLIDAVTDADTTNVLRSPIDGSPITTDILGNPRTEAGGTVRNIGAVQLGLAPTLNLEGVGDSTAELTWTRPVDPASGAITGYEVCFGTGNVPEPSALGTDCKDGDGNPGTLETISNAPDTLAGQVTGLTNGDTYWFLVRGVNPNPGPWSNVETGTPGVVPGAPVVAATSGDGLVSLTWGPPVVDGGFAITDYTVRYRESGSATWNVWPHAGVGTTANIGGLTNGLAYEFAVNAINALGSGPDDLVAAVPQAPLFVQYATPVQISEGSLLTLYPTYGNVVGTPSYSFVGIAPPAWLSINTSTGVVSGTPPGASAGDYTVTVQLTRTGPPAGTATADLVIQVLGTAQNPYLNYLNYTGPAGAAVTVTPTVAGLTPPFTFSNTNASLPPGLSLIDPATGVIGGTPTTVGFWNAEMRVLEDDPPNQQQNDASAITVTPRLAYPMVSGTVGTALSVLPVVPPLQVGESYSYALGGSLPPGLSFAPATGEISGTPVSALSSAVDVTVSVTLPTGTFTATTHVGLTIQDYAITFTYPQQSLTIGQPFSLAPTVSGTIGTTVFAVDGGALPGGVTLNPDTGEISGTMTSDLNGTILRITLTDQYSSASALAVLQGTRPLPESVPIPTGGRWGTLLLALLVLSAGMVGFRRLG
jgi:hypothetical protein